MIKVIFPQGCYGNFVARCVFELTDISNKTPCQDMGKNFEFDETGSSHIFRQNIESQKYIICGHLPELEYNQSDTIIAIVPCQQHFLDYFDNQFVKNERQQIIGFIRTMFSWHEIQQKMYEGWGYRGALDHTTPRWLLREWCSFWLQTCLQNSYDAGPYLNLPTEIHVATPDLFEDLYRVLQTISEKSGVRLLATKSQVAAIQSKFIQCQVWHNMQNRCQDWVNNVINCIDAVSPCMTVFDEAWVQHRLRLLGYEIQCTGLDDLPKNSKHLSGLIESV